MLTNNYDQSQFLLFNITTDKGNTTNASGSAITLLLGTTIGRIASTGLLTQSISTATDGSQVPIGALATSYTIPNGATQEVTFVAAGEVDAAGIKLATGDTLATSITDNSTRLGTIGDILRGKGIILKGAMQLTYFDNQ